MSMEVTSPILVIFPGALGDLICLIPALRAIARRHREAPLEIMARAELVRFATGRLGLDGGRSAKPSTDVSAGRSQSASTGDSHRLSESASTGDPVGAAQSQSPTLGDSSGAAQSANRRQSRGHSIDRREVAQLFAARSGPISDEARTFFGEFSYVYSFFAADDEHFRSALM